MLGQYCSPIESIISTNLVSSRRTGGGVIRFLSNFGLLNPFQIARWWCIGKHQGNFLMIEEVEPGCLLTWACDRTRFHPLGRISYLLQRPIPNQLGHAEPLLLVKVAFSLLSGQRETMFAKTSNSAMRGSVSKYQQPSELRAPPHYQDSRVNYPARSIHSQKFKPKI